MFTCYDVFARIELSLVLQSFLMFVLDVLAQSQVAAESVASPFLSLVPLVLIFVIFFFLVIRPQHKRVKLHNQMLASLKKGDKILSSSGIIGIINKIDSVASIIHLEIAKGVEVKITKSSVSDKLTASPEDAKDAAKIKKEPNSKEERALEEKTVAEMHGEND